MPRKSGSGYVVLIGVLAGVYELLPSGKHPDQPLPAAHLETQFTPVRLAAPAGDAPSPATPPNASPAGPAAPPPTSAIKPDRDTKPVFIRGHKVPLRAAPDGKALILDRVDQPRELAELERRDGWAHVRDPLTSREGWVSTKRVLETRPKPDESSEPKVSPGALLSAAAIAKLIIAASISDYPSSCACPYQTDRGGRSCGRRSAYSRPGGYAPICYEADVTPSMVADYRARH